MDCPTDICDAERKMYIHACIHVVGYCHSCNICKVEELESLATAAAATSRHLEQIFKVMALNSMCLCCHRMHVQCSGYYYTH